MTHKLGYGMAQSILNQWSICGGSCTFSGQAWDTDNYVCLSFGPFHLPVMVNDLQLGRTLLLVLQTTLARDIASGQYIGKSD